MIYLAWVVFIGTIGLIVSKQNEDKQRTESFTPFTLSTFQKTRSWVALTYIFWFYFGL